MDKKQQTLYDLFKVIRETSIFFDFDNKEKTIRDCEFYMNNLKSGFVKSDTSFEGLFRGMFGENLPQYQQDNINSVINKADEILKSKGHEGASASDFFKNFN